MKFITTTLFVLCCMLVNSAWSGQGEEVNIVIEKNAAGEEILEINGERVNLSEELENLDADLHGLLKELKFLGGKGKPDQAFIGILLEQEDPDAAGVNVIGITPDSPAQKAGLKAGDLITAINDTSLAGDAQKSPGKKLLLELQQLKAGEDAKTAGQVVRARCPRAMASEEAEPFLDSVLPQMPVETQIVDPGDAVDLLPGDRCFDLTSLRVSFHREQDTKAHGQQKALETFREST